MIKSITFDGKSGYIIKTIEEPKCPVRCYSGFKHKSDEEKKKLSEYKKEHKKWEKHKDDYVNPQLVKNLIGRKIEFKPNKINLIYGPNASGKTTILKALAGNAGTTDGFPKLVGPLNLKGMWEDVNHSHVRKYLDGLMGNSASIEWDGAPVYYDNFANRQSYGHIGNLGGSVLGDDIITEAMYIMGKKKISMGQNSLYLINKLFNIAKDNLCYADIFSKYVENNKIKDDFGYNDTWNEAYRVQLEYYLGFEKSFKKSPCTFLFDEIDKSLDVMNIYTLYNEILPEFVKNTGVQIIIISHSPLVLSDKIMNGEIYNFISMDDEYTKKCKETMKKLF